MAPRALRVQQDRGDQGAVGKPWLVLALALGPVFIGALDLTVVSAVLPAVLVDLRIELQSGLDDASWVVSGYLLAYALGVAFGGRLSDVFGRGRVLVVALALFFVGSWWVAVSGELPAQWVTALRRLMDAPPDHSLAALSALSAGRVVQGVAAGALVPAAMALAGDLFPPGRRALPLGVVAAVDTAGWVLGHLYGGLMVQRFPWQAIFWVNLPLTALALAAVWLALRRVEQRLAPGGVDIAGAAWLALALVALDAGLTANETPETVGLLPSARAPAYALPLVIAGLACGAFFLWRERRVTAPLLRTGLRAQRGARTAAATNLLLGFCLMVGLVSVPLLINATGARSSQEGALASGYLLACFTIPLALAALAGGVLAARANPRAIVALGLVVASAGFVLVSGASVDTARRAVEWIAGEAGAAPVAALLAGLVLAGVGLGLTIAPLASVVLDAAGELERGRAAALLLVLRLVGMMTAVSTMTTYGLRRVSALGEDAYRAVPLEDTERVVATTRDLVARVTSEMALIAASVCLLALPLALLAGAKRVRG